MAALNTFRQIEAEMGILDLERRVEEMDARMERLEVLVTRSCAAGQSCVCDQAVNEGAGVDREDVEELRCQIREVEKQVQGLAEVTMEELEILRNTLLPDAEIQSGFGDHENAADSKSESDCDFSSTEPSRHTEDDAEHDNNSTDPPTPVFPLPHSPYRLSTRTSMHAKAGAVKYIALYLPHNFSFSFSSRGNTHTHIITYKVPATVYHFANTCNVSQELLWRAIRDDQPYYRDFRKEDMDVIKVESLEMERGLKSAITEFWEGVCMSRGGCWEYLTSGAWEEEGGGDTYIVATPWDAGPDCCGQDNMLTEACIRGGGHGTTTTNAPPPLLEPIQRPSSSHLNLAEHFTSSYGRILQQTYSDSSSVRMSGGDRILDSWISLATTLQTRNRYLERELEEFEEMYYSATQDVKWLMGTLVEVEEKLESQLEDGEELVGEGGGSLDEFWPFSPPEDDDNQSPHNKIPIEQETTGDLHFFSEDLLDTEANASHITTTMATSFEFFPADSTITFSSSSFVSPQIYKFPDGSTLPEIYEILKYRCERGIENDVCLVRIRKIMERREEMGVGLPEVLRDEMVVIGIPEGGLDGGGVKWKGKGKGRAKIEEEVDIEAWETWLDDDAEALDLIFKQLDVRDEDDPIDSESLTPDTHSDFEPSVLCDCEICTDPDPNPYLGSRDSYTSPLITVRGGAGNERSSSTQDSDSDTDLQYFSFFPSGFSRYQIGIQRENSQESIRHEDDAPTPTTTTARSSPKEANDDRAQGSKKRNYNAGNEYPFPIVEDPDPRLRGGGAYYDDEDAEEEEAQDWIPEWYCRGRRMHCSGCRCKTLQNETDTRSSSLLDLDRHSSTRKHHLQALDLEDLNTQMQYNTWRAKYQHRFTDPNLAIPVLRGASVMKAATAEPPVDDSPMDPRPKTSPYTNSPAALVIGPERRTYYVPQSLLQIPELIITQDPWGGEKQLPDVDAGTGHVLVHYLYTGMYQTLNDTDYSTTTKAVVEFKRAFLAYMVGERYKLQGLEDLAKNEIELHGADLDAFGVVDAIKDNFSKFPEDITWFHEYLDKKIQSALHASPSVFASYEFLNRIEDAALLRMLTRNTAQLYTDKVSEVLHAKQERTTEVPDYTTKAQDSPDDKPSAEECPAHNEDVAEECAIEDCPVEGCPVEESPPVEPCQATEDSIPVEAYYSEVQPAQDYSVEDLIDQGRSFGEPVSAGLTFGFKFPAPSTAPMDLTQVPSPPVVEDKPPEDDGGGVNFGTAGKKKKKKKDTKVKSKIKSKRLVKEPPPPPPPIESEPELLPEPEPEPEVPQPESISTDDWGFPGSSINWSKKKKKKSVAVPDSPAEEPCFKPPPPAVEEKESDPWAAFFTANKGKKVKKGKSLFVPSGAPVPPPYEPEVVPEPEVIPEADSAPEIDGSMEAPESPENVDLREEVDVPIDDSDEVLIAEPAQPIDAEENVCPRRGYHLLKTSRWKNCKRCRAFLGQVAIQIARMDVSDEDGYEVLDRIVVK
ncbi:hypothetical protein N0V83_010615 [Neocucurbitaria cava]|uniref:Uncharacterized protein n=1 Tax=Neocucurbitaria cava TaxID=798079 RepID=A0A9W9CHM9_9PLEO|nr:hypothetical protein N0V83_010615 [Neocucurbitaria cava]